MQAPRLQVTKEESEESKMSYNDARRFEEFAQKEALDAKLHPEEHGDLLVRIGGYSDFFVKLSPELQDEVISRTQNEF